MSACKILRVYILPVQLTLLKNKRKFSHFTLASVLHIQEQILTDKASEFNNNLIIYVGVG